NVPHPERAAGVSLPTLVRRVIWLQQADACRSPSDFFQSSDTLDRPLCGITNQRLILICRPPQRRQMRCIAAVAQHDASVAGQSRTPRARQRRVSETLPETLLIERQQFQGIDQPEIFPRLKRRLRRRRCLAVPRADIVADIAAEQPLADAL